ncbi:hypothetical protein KC357_g208 [Hortaea werneckii]|nr:hypothetical protein KC357_g208 [Hortaea werneckii]
MDLQTTPAISTDPTPNDLFTIAKLTLPLEQSSVSRDHSYNCYQKETKVSGQLWRVYAVLARGGKDQMLFVVVVKGCESEVDRWSAIRESYPRNEHNLKLPQGHPFAQPAHDTESPHTTPRGV